MRRNEESYIKISGGIVTSHFVSLMQDEEHGFEYAEPQTFIRPWREDDEPVTDEKDFIKQVVGIWNNLLRRFDEKYKDINAGRISAEDVRKMWQFRILDALGFEPTYTSKQIVLSDKLKYKFSHRGWFYHKDKKIPKPPVIHILPPGTNPDDRPERGKPSPQDALQDCLNRHDATWAMLMNESVIRILRDYHHTTVPGYIEFDLVGIFLNRSFPEFLALYRFCHASRFARGSNGSNEPLENYYEVSRQAGEKIGESLRENVVRAIEELGNGFLDSELLVELKDDESCRAYYQEILTVVYRIIFMLFAEQRGMLGGGDHGKLFLEEYSITSLRERTDSFLGRDDGHTDIWEGLSVTFRMLEEGVPELGVNAFDGMLFSAGNLEYLRDAKCRNTYLMNAIRELTWTRPEESGRGRRRRVYGRQRISYADLSVEEIGAIYESLLDYRPRITEAAEEVNNRERRPGEFVLDPAGSERKTTGSYYTNPDLVAELIKSALDPVIRERLSQAGPDPAEREKALLSIRVCDPACGSGAFLIAASNRLGQELAKIRGGTEFPGQQEIQAARRDVLSHCIYGVDLNPMAVELAKVSMWINALVKDRPLSFLDHHIKCGNSLIGTTPELLAGGIPDGAYSPVEGDIKEIASKIKATNKKQRESKTFDEFSGISGVLDACAKRFAALSDASEDNPDAVERKKEEYEKLVKSSEYEKEHLAADMWCSAFFWPLEREHEKSVPTTGTVRMVQSHGKSALSEDDLKEVRVIADSHRFFHWHLEFPEVFADGGFDCVLGNPPWERLQFEERVFFKNLDDKIFNENNQSKRKKLIDELKIKNPVLYTIWLKEKKKIEKETLFLRNCCKYLLSANDKFNLYAVFAELSGFLFRKNGTAGLILKGGFVSDKLCSDLFSKYLENKKIVSIIEFENKKKIFPAVHPQERFLLVTLSHNVPKSSFSFDNLDINQIYDVGRFIEMTYGDISLLSPNTHNCPKFVNMKEFYIVKKCYLIAGSLIIKNPYSNVWDAHIDRYINVSDFSSDIVGITDINEDHPKIFNKDYSLVPIIEGKMFYIYDHHYATYNTDGSFQNIESNDKNNYSNVFSSRYLSPLIALRKNPSLLDSTFLIAIRDITNRTNERGMIASIIPANITDYTVRILVSSQEILNQIILVSNLNSYILDFITRQKIGGTHLSNYILEQLPVLPPSTYTPALIDFIAPRVIELTYTAWDLEAFARDVLGEVGEEKWNEWFPENAIGDDGVPRPFVWDEDRRFDLRCDLDALYFHLYDISRDDADYIMETFPIVKRKDVAKYGSYRTKEVILKKYDELEDEFIRVMRADFEAVQPSDEKKWADIILSGETDKVEFKSSISYDVRQKQKNKVLEHVIAKTIAAFMNTDGGVLFAGIEDDGNIFGLEKDISLAKGQNEDGLKLHFDNLVKNYLGDRFSPLIRINSIKKDAKIFWAIEVKKAGEPVFVKNGGDEEFWIRASASSRKLGMSDTIEYIRRWD